MSFNLPTARVKTVMKSSSEVEVLSQESVALVARSTEYFIIQLTKRGFDEASNSFLDYNHLANAVHADSRYDFLKEIMPKKITVREYKRIKNQKKREQEGYESSENSSSEDSSDDSASESGMSTESSVSENITAPTSTAEIIVIDDDTITKT